MQQYDFPFPFDVQFGADAGHCAAREHSAPAAKSGVQTPLLHQRSAAQSLSVLQPVQPDPSVLQTWLAPQVTQFGPHLSVVLHVVQVPALHQLPGVEPLPSEHAGPLPQRHPLPPMPQLFATSGLHAIPQAVQLLKSLARLRQAACDEQQFGVAPVHCVAPSSATPLAQLLSMLSQSSGAPGYVVATESLQSPPPSTVADAAPTKGEQASHLSPSRSRSSGTVFVA